MMEGFLFGKNGGSWERVEIRGGIMGVKGGRGMGGVRKLEKIFGVIVVDRWE